MYCILDIWTLGMCISNQNNQCNLTSTIIIVYILILQCIVYQRLHVYITMYYILDSMIR